MANRIGIVAFAFGVPSTIESNKRIGKIASELFRELNAAGIFTQRDVSTETGDELSTYYFSKEDLKNPPPTLRIARAAVEWAEVCRIKQLWVVAAKPHLWRAVRDTEKAVRESGLRILVTPANSEIEQFPEDSWFCSDSTQERTQSKANWEKRERILRWTPFWLYKLIAS